MSDSSNNAQFSFNPGASAKSRRIVFTGGGSAGHVTLNLALIPWFLEQGWQVSYIGSKGGMEQELVSRFSEVRYYGILTGKLRRYFSWQNFLDMAKIPLGCLQACWLVRKINPDIIFSKGGFVSFPVVVGGFVNRKRIFMHESDITPGLANKLSLPFVGTFFTTFPETVQSVSRKGKVSCVGPVLSDRLFNGSREKGAAFAGLDPSRPTVMVIGGSLGARSLNEAVARNLPQILAKYQLIHIAGKNGFNPELQGRGYVQYEYVDTELKDLMALADIVVSRAGSNSIFELASLYKPMILVPLPAASSRGEQSLNAQSFVDKGYAEIIRDEDIADPEILLPMLDKVYAGRAAYTEKCAKTRSKSLPPPRFANKSVPLPHRHKICLSEQYLPPVPRHHFLPVRCLFCSLYPVPYLSAVYAFSSGFRAFCQPFAAREKVKPRPRRRVFSPGLQRIPHTAPLRQPVISGAVNFFPSRKHRAISAIIRASVYCPLMP